VLTAGFGVTREQSDLLTATIGALLSRAKLDSATGNNKTLPAVTVSTLRVTAGAESGWTHGNWRPFLIVHLRTASGGSKREQAMAAIPHETHFPSSGFS